MLGPVPLDGRAMRGLFLDFTDFAAGFLSFLFGFVSCVIRLRRLSG
jgi:hypothetical protein